MSAPTLQELTETVTLVQEMFDYAMPKFNWGASALDAKALDLLNRSMLKVDRIVARLPKVTP